DDVEQADRELRQARDAAEQLRLVPARVVFHALELAARDAVATTGKRATFEALGGDLRLDAHTLAVVQPALIQLVRHAVAHGIETPARRAVAGKRPDGRVSLAVIRRGSRVAFVCHDDGGGIDVVAVRRAAAARGLATDDGAGPGDLLHLLLRGGIST